MAEDLHTQITITANADGVEAGVTRARRSFASLAQGVNEAGAQVGTGLQKAGDGADQAAQKADRGLSAVQAAIRRSQAETQRLLVDSQGYGRGSAEAIEQLARVRGQDVASIQGQLGALRQLRSEYDTVVAAQREDAAVALFDRQHEAAKQLVRDASYVRMWTEALEEKERAERQSAGQNAFIESLRAQSQAIGKSRVDLLEMQAAQMGVGTQAAPFIARLRASEQGLDRMGVSAAQTAAALRQLPAQFSDIVVSLQGGQAPLTVLLQQGSQIKDSFGGAGEAARALGGYVLGLVNPFALGAAALGVLALAYNAGAKEADAYRKSIVLTGNASGTTVSQLQAYAQQISAVVGTQGAAAESLAAMAATGKVSSAVLREAGEAAVQYGRATGESVADIAGQFASLAREPLDGVLKLNDGMNFLTEAAYRQIKSLEEQGRVADAARVAQLAYADALKSRGKEIEANLGSIETAWLRIKDAAKGAWDTILNVGRADTVGDQLARARASLEERTKRGPLNESTRGAWEKGLENLRQEIGLLSEQERMQKRAAEQDAQRAQNRQLLFAWEKQGDDFKTKAAKRQEEIQRAEVEGRALIAAGLIQEADLRERIADITKKFQETKTGSAGVGQNEVADLRARAAETEKYLAQLREQGPLVEKLSEGEKRANKIREELRTNVSGAARAQKELALVEAERIAAAERAIAGEQMRIEGLERSKQAYASLIDATRQSAQNLAQQADELAVSNELWGKGRVAVEEYRLALLRAKLVEVEGGSDSSYDPAYVRALQDQVAAQTRKVDQQRIADFKTMNQQADELLRSANAMADSYADEARMAGLSAVERNKIVARRQVELKYAKEIADVDRSSLTDEQKTAAREKLRSAERIEIVNAEYKVMRDEGQRTADEISRSLTDALMRGFESGRGFLENLRSVLKSTVLTVAVKPVLDQMTQPLLSSLSGLIGQMLGVPDAAAGGKAGAASNVLGLANNASSLYSLYNNAGSYVSKIGSLFGLGGGAGEAALLANEAANAAYWSSAFGMGGGSAAGGGTAAAAAGGWSASSVIPIIGWILAGIGASSTMYGKGYSINGVETGTDMLLTGGVTKVNNKVLGAFMSDKWADILSGGPLLDKTLDLLGISTGEKRFGGQYGYSASSDQVLNGRRGTYVSGVAGQATFLEGPSGGQFGQDKVGELITSTVKGINGIFDALESDARVTDFVAGLETSGKGRGGVYSGGTLTGGVLFGESGKGDNYKGTLFEKTSTQSPNAQKAFENFTLDLQQATIQALQKATDIPKSIQEYLKQFNAEEMTTEQIQEALTAIGQRAAVIGEFRDALKALPFENLRALSFDTAEALIAAAGGLDALNTNLSGYFQNYFSQEEQRAAAVAATSKAFADLGLAMPSLEQSSEAARAAFRAMVSSIDVTSEKGREQYVGLLALQAAFADLTPIIDNTAEVAQAAAAALQERQSLENQLLQLQGDTDEIRRRQMAALLSDEARALQQAIYDLQDKQAADAAAEAAAAAAERVKAAWQSTADSIVDEILRIRGEASPDAGLAELQAQFAVATAQARAGDQEAANSLPALSRQVLELIDETAASALELRIAQAQMAASLAETAKAIAASQGLTLPAFADGGSHAGGWAVVGERGPELAYMPPSQIYTASQSASMLGDAEAVGAKVDQLRDDLRRIGDGLASLQLRQARSAEATQRLLESLTDGGVALRTSEIS
jgi:phage-related minor tail protein